MNAPNAPRWDTLPQNAYLQQMIVLLSERDYTFAELRAHFEVSLAWIAQKASGLERGGFATARTVNREKVLSLKPGIAEAYQLWAAQHPQIPVEDRVVKLLQQQVSLDASQLTRRLHLPRKDIRQAIDKLVEKQQLKVEGETYSLSD